ncbi:Heat shock 70 kDa protein [Ooceraea biroi]|uniref:Heat shock 70 kDa protein n=1 Tax=Ooceraea biroi TaxID=2015173 RepID=A0A026WXW1_OOCBI|nr:Heat shock 70 kDa protein [Ooceraea biroi]
MDQQNKITITNDKGRERIAAKNNLESYCSNVRSALEEEKVKGKIPELTQRYRAYIRLRGTRGSVAVVGRKSDWLPRRTERRECVESICHGAGHVDANRQEGSGKKYSHFPRSGERRQGLGDGIRSREIDGNGRTEQRKTAVEAPGQRVRTREPTRVEECDNSQQGKVTNCRTATRVAARSSCEEQHGETMCAGRTQSSSLRLDLHRFESVWHISDKSDAYRAFDCIF